MKVPEKLHVLTVHPQLQGHHRKEAHSQACFVGTFQLVNANMIYEIFFNSWRQIDKVPSAKGLALKYDTCLALGLIFCIANKTQNKPRKIKSKMTDLPKKVA